MNLPELITGDELCTCILVNDQVSHGTEKFSTGTNDKSHSVVHRAPAKTINTMNKLLIQGKKMKKLASNSNSMNLSGQMCLMKMYFIL